MNITGYSPFCEDLNNSVFCNLWYDEDTEIVQYGDLFTTVFGSSSSLRFLLLLQSAGELSVYCTLLSIRTTHLERSMACSKPTTQEQKEREEKMMMLQETILLKQAEYDKLQAKINSYQFKYTPPEPNFDTNRVMGTVCNIIKTYDPFYIHALEYVAGEYLNCVVVDSAKTADLLNARGNLPIKPGFIPLSRFRLEEEVDRGVVNVAKEIAGPENVHLAVDLITYDEKYGQMMGWLFGKTLVCKTLAWAAKLAYHPRLRCTFITHDADIMNPDGTCTGGTPPEGRELHDRHMINVLFHELETAKAEHAELIAN